MAAEEQECQRDDQSGVSVLYKDLQFSWYLTCYIMKQNLSYITSISMERVGRKMSAGRYIDIPGSQTHELPPLLVHWAAEHAAEQRGYDLESMMPEAEDMLAAHPADAIEIEQRKFELALQLAEQYKSLVSHWSWGDSVLEWIRQCEITFESEGVLRKLLHPDVWPHASRASFVALLLEKGIATHGVALDRAVGMRLAFRQPPPVDCVSSQFLFYLNSAVSRAAYDAWARLAPQDASLFPPNRFHFDVLSVGN
jgi:hypothetical protein